MLKAAGAGGRDLGYWDAPGATEHHDGRVMDTCLRALMLEVYYRDLPSYQPPTETDDRTDLATGADEVDVRVTL